LKGRQRQPKHKQTEKAEAERHGYAADGAAGGADSKIQRRSVL